MQDLIIVGAGGFGRELVEIVEAINYQKPTWNLLGFIDDTPEKQGTLQNRYPVLGTIDGWEVEEGQHFVIAIAKPENKKMVVKKLETRGAEFVSIIHPNAWISPNAVYGKGLVVYFGGALGVDTRTGDYVTLLCSSVGHDAQIGNYATISSYCGINGGVSIGEEAFIGSNAILAPKVKVGERAKVGIGSVVIRNVKAGTTVFGNPAKRILEE